MNYQKLFKYLIMFIIVVLAVNYAPLISDSEEHYGLIVGFIASISFAILDIYSPSIVIERNDN